MCYSLLNDTCLTCYGQVLHVVIWKLANPIVSNGVRPWINVAGSLQWCSNGIHCKTTSAHTFGMIPRAISLSLECLLYMVNKEELPLVPFRYRSVCPLEIWDASASSSPIHAPMKSLEYWYRSLQVQHKFLKNYSHLMLLARFILMFKCTIFLFLSSLYTLWLIWLWLTAFCHILAAHLLLSHAF